MRTWAQSLASLSGWRIRCCCKLWCRSQTWLKSALLWLWCRLAATAPVRPQAWEPPCAVPTALKKKEDKNRKIGAPQCSLLLCLHYRRHLRLKCPSTKEWRKKTWYIYTIEYYSAMKRKKVMAFAATLMEQEMTILSEVSQTVKDKHHVVSLLCGILKKDTNELICKRETDSQTLKTNLWSPKGTGRGGMVWALGTGICTLWYKEWLADGDLLCSTGNAT